ncbi:MAG: orotidine 5'-phosphate decarboxylase [Legionella sp. 21-45-4]|nr:MAG: orotidine 5'-phosphate decarboxylase [Legionella sp. 21-45-4]
MSKPLIIALDFDGLESTLACVDKLDPKHCQLKVGSELFTRCGEGLVRLLIAREFQVFLDLKFHDIPHTVARACKAAADLGVWMLDVHVSGGLSMLEAAVKALDSYPVMQRPLLIGVTVLTSHAPVDLQRIGVHESLQEYTCHLAQLANATGLDGVVSAAHHVPLIKSLCGEHFIAVTPGIRMREDVHDDQISVATPRQALELGSDYLVVGRSITRALDPGLRVQDILQSCV